MDLEESRRRNEQILKESLLGSIPLRTGLDLLGKPEDVALVNVYQFALLFNFDLTCLIADTEQHRGSWRSKLYSRQLVVTMHECLEDFSALLGGDFRRNLNRFDDSESLTQTLNSLHRRLHVLRSTHSGDYAEVRNTVVAHREHDARQQIEVLRNLKVTEVLAVAYELMEWLNDLYGFMNPLVQRIRPAKHGGITTDDA